MYKKSDVTNEDILKAIADIAAQGKDTAQNLRDFMQMTSEGMDKLDRNMEGVVERLDGVEGEVRMLKGEVQDLKQTSYRHELQLNETQKLAQATHEEQLNMHIDMNEILHRLLAVKKRLPPRNRQTSTA